MPEAPVGLCSTCGRQSAIIADCVSSEARGQSYSNATGPINGDMKSAAPRRLTKHEGYELAPAFMAARLIVKSTDLQVRSLNTKAREPSMCTSTSTEQVHCN